MASSTQQSARSVRNRNQILLLPWLKPFQRLSFALKITCPPLLPHPAALLNMPPKLLLLLLTSSAPASWTFMFLEQSSLFPLVVPSAWTAFPLTALFSSFKSQLNCSSSRKHSLISKFNKRDTYNTVHIFIIALLTLLYNYYFAFFQH